VQEVRIVQEEPCRKVSVTTKTILGSGPGQLLNGDAISWYGNESMRGTFVCGFLFSSLFYAQGLEEYLPLSKCAKYMLNK
jgi:hypothetical protein